MGSLAGKRRIIAMWVAATCVIASAPAPARADFGLSSFDNAVRAMDGSPANQAGSHPFDFETSFELNRNGSETDGRLREVLLDLPPGLVADTTAYPRCVATDFIAGTCSLSTVLGSSTIESLEAGHLEDARIYNLEPGEGELMRLGFEIGGEGVFVDVFLNQAPPFNALAVMAESPATFDVFGVDLHIWGVPASPVHNAQRGGSAGVPEIPLLTLPTRCDGPLETLYEALAWGGDEDTGSVRTHDDEGNPLGLSGCSNLAFEPLATARPTIDAAQSPSGLDISVDFVDGGLTNAGGVAQSHVRDLEISLPPGMTVGSLLESVAGSCSEAALETTTPESAGCPASSNVGTVVAESPLIGGHAIHGTIHRATPHANFAGDAAMALYVSLRDASLGVDIAQPVALETDLGTGELLAIAEEMPRLPFSHLSLHLDDGEDGPLVNPALCGTYEAGIEFIPWSDDVWYATASKFSLDTGPGGGPCPSGESTHPPNGDSPPSAGSTASTPVLAPSARPCPKGTHRVHRHGKARCVRRRHCRKGRRRMRRQGRLRCVRIRRHGHRRHRSHHRHRGRAATAQEGRGSL